MRVLIDILHPAHVHFFRFFRSGMIDRGHEVLVTARDKDVAVELLDELAIPCEVLSVQRTGLLGLAGELMVRSARLAKVVRRFRPDVMTGIMGPSIAPVGRLARRPSVVFYDTEWANRTNRFVYPMATRVCTPDSYAGKVHGNHVTYPGYHELAYLHPQRFTPSEDRLSQYGLSPGYALVRFVSWEASHDAGHDALDRHAKVELVRRLQEEIRVVVSAEGPLPPDLEPLRLRGPTADIHHVLAHAAVVVGDSGTMTSEAAVLGTPAVFISPMRAGVHLDQAGYGLVSLHSPSDLGAAWDAVARFLGRERPLPGHERLLADKIDVASWMIDYFESKLFEVA